MPGVVTVAVREGERIGADQQAGIVEATKRESVIRAPADRTVESLAASSGTDVEAGDLLAVLSPE